MKHSRLVLTALAVLAIGSWATLASACDKAKVTTAAASSKSSACTAEMAALCTPEMAAACKAKGATAAGAQGCSYHGQSSAVKTASSAGCGSKGKTTSATTAAVQGGGSSVDAVFAGAGAGCNHGSAVTASASAGCGSKGKTTSATTAAVQGGASSVDAVLVGSGGSCSGHGTAKTAGSYKHADCDACADMAFCDGEVRALGATVQVVPLKNGVMYVYTAEAPNKVHAVQASMGRRSERMVTMLAANDKAKLCPSCKSVRGAIASGKLNRELVNIEGGCLTLMTSEDAATVSKIYTLAGLKGPVSVKS